MSKLADTNAISIFLATFDLEKLNVQLAALGMAPQTEAKTAADVLSARVRSIDEMVVVTLNLSEGAVKPAVMTDILANAFPNHNIGDRHGPHYMSLARNGKIGGKIPVTCLVPMSRGGGAKKPNPVAAAIMAVDFSKIPPEQLRAIREAAKGTELEALIPPEPKAEEPKAEEPKTEDEVVIDPKIAENLNDNATVAKPEEPKPEDEVVIDPKIAENLNDNATVAKPAPKRRNSRKGGQANA